MIDSIVQLRSGIGNIDLLAGQELNDTSPTGNKRAQTAWCQFMEVRGFYCEIDTRLGSIRRLANDQHFPHVIPGQEELERRIVAKQVLDVAIVKNALQAKLWTALQT